MSEEKLSLRIEIQGVHKDYFEKVKRDFAFKSNTDVIRFCIKETAQSTDFELDDDLRRIIKSYLENDNVKIKYSIFSVSDFVKKAIENLVNDIQDNLESIKSWDIRSKLSTEEAEIALALIECQSENDADHVTVDEIAKKLDRRNTEKIATILEDFVRRGILSSQPLANQKYYHAV